MNSIIIDNKTPPKSRQQIYKENYQKNKQRKKQQRQERYQQNKEAEKTQQKKNYAKKKMQTQLLTKQNQAKYSSASAYKILMSLKEYTELNQAKMKLWQDFNWTLQDCQEIIKEGISDITPIMKLAQVADNLVRDYWTTAKSEQKQKSKSWNLLDYDQQQKLIRYWGYEKARVENGYIEENKRLEKQSQEYLKDIELAKFHEERGKINCDCGYCEEVNKIKAGVKKARQKIIKDFEEEQKKSREIESEWIRGECFQCGEYKKVDSDSGLCKKCFNSEG